MPLLHEDDHEDNNKLYNSEEIIFYVSVINIYWFTIGCCCCVQCTMYIQIYLNIFFFFLLFTRKLLINIFLLFFGSNIMNKLNNKTKWKRKKLKLTIIITNINHVESSAKGILVLELFLCYIFNEYFIIAGELVNDSKYLVSSIGYDFSFIGAHHANVSWSTVV